MDTQKIKQLANAIKNAHSVVVFTGAGISVPSGIPDFRSNTGLYSTNFGNFAPETIISHDFFYEHTDVFYEFYRRKMLYPNAKPNAMHNLIAKLENAGKVSCVITQNIDGLHQMAGSVNVCELHGAVGRNYCVKCHKFFDLDYVYNANGVPKCDKCGGIIKPDVVLYGEGLDGDVVSRAVSAIRKADIFIVVGTSLVVYPAAGLVSYFRGGCSVVINKSSTSYDRYADILLNEDCQEVAQLLAQELDIALE